MRFVIIGGDAAGMSAASRAKRNQPDLDVIVLEMTQDVSYSACGMPYNIAERQRDIDDLVVRHAKVFRDKQGIDLRTGHRVETLLLDTKEVTGKVLGGEAFALPYDKLMIATGAKPIMPDLPGIDLPGVMALKSLEDGRRIKHFISSNGVKRAVIIGMGYIALEMVEALHALGIEVEMVKPRSVFMPWMHQDMADVVKDEIESHGVKMHLGYKIKRIERSSDQLNVVCDGGVLEGDMVLVGIGVRPRSELAQAAGLDLGPGNAISVDRKLKTSHEDVYAAGDCADAFHIVTGKKTWIPLALRANRAGWAVADNILGKNTELEGVAGTAVFKVFEMQVARTGLSVAQAEEVGFDPAEAIIKTGSRAHAHPGSTDIWVQIVGDKKTGLLLGTQLIGKEGAAHRVNAPAVALHAKMTVEEYCQSDLAYAPPFGPTWDPTLIAGNQLMKKL